MQKLHLLLLLLMIHSISSSQELKLESLTLQNKESKTVYIGVDNFFKITNPGYVKSVISQQGVELLGDSLRIRAYTTGELSVVFITKDGRENIVFDTKVISSPFPSINGWTDEMVDKSFLLKNGTLTIETFRTDDNFHEGYLITSFKATINNETFSINGNTFSDKLLAAIRKAKKGDKLIINQYTAYNETTKKGMKSSGASYQINE